MIIQGRYKPQKMMRKHFFILYLIVMTVDSMAQEASTTLESRYAKASTDWLLCAEKLRTYDGLTTFCNNVDYRKETINLLGLIHHYDSLVLRYVSDPANTTDLSHRDYRSTLKDIGKFEEEYSVKSFIVHLKNNCGELREIERSKEELKNNSGMYSYDGQKLILETELGNYLKHTEKRVREIEKHVHLLHMDDVNAYEPVQ